MPDNSTSRFRDFSNVNAIDVARFEASEVRQVLRVLEDLEADIVRVLETEKPSIRRQKRIAEVRRSVENAINDAYSTIKVATKGNLADFAKVTHESTVAAMNEAIGATVFNPTLTERQLSRLANPEIMFGRNGAASISQWWDGQRNDFKLKTARQIRLGYALGEGSDDIARRLIGTEGANFVDGVTSVSKRNAEVLARTAVQSVSNEARLGTYAANADVVKGIEWLATLDDRTCPICSALDGLQWELNANGSIGDPIGHAKRFPGPVAHFQCRCTQISVTRSWDELNGATEGTETPPADPKVEPPPEPRDEADEDTGEPIPIATKRKPKPDEDPDEPVPLPRKPDRKKIEPALGAAGGMTDGNFENRVRAEMARMGVEPEAIDKAVVRGRATMDGQASDSKDFDQWLRDQSDTRRKKILGPSKKALFDRGVITTRDLTDQSNRPLTVKELQRKAELGLFVAAETEGIRQAFKALEPGSVKRFTEPDRAAEVERAASARIEDTLRNPGGRELLAAELQRVLNEPGAGSRSPAENYARAEARVQALEAASRKANTLRNARSRLIRGDSPTPSQARLIEGLSEAERRNFDAWVRDGRK